MFVRHEWLQLKKLLEQKPLDLHALEGHVNKIRVEDTNLDIKFTKSVTNIRNRNDSNTNIKVSKKEVNTGILKKITKDLFVRMTSNNIKYVQK